MDGGQSDLGKDLLTMEIVFLVFLTCSSDIVLIIQLK